MHFFNPDNETVSMYAVMLFFFFPRIHWYSLPLPTFFFFRVKNRGGSFNKRLVLFTTVRHQVVFEHTANKFNVFLNHQFSFPTNRVLVSHICSQSSKNEVHILVIYKSQIYTTKKIMQPQNLFCMDVQFS